MIFVHIPPSIPLITNAIHGFEAGLCPYRMTQVSYVRPKMSFVPHHMQNQNDFRTHFAQYTVNYKYNTCICSKLMPIQDDSSIICQAKNILCPITCKNKMIFLHISPSIPLITNAIYGFKAGRCPYRMTQVSYVRQKISFVPHHMQKQSNFRTKFFCITTTNLKSSLWNVLQGAK